MHNFAGTALTLIARYQLEPGGVEPLQESESQERKPAKVNIIISTTLLGLIAVLTAWSGFQSAKWGGVATDFSLQSNSARSQSSEASLTANQLQILDIQIFMEWVNATLQEDTARATFYQRRMRDEAKPAFNAWLATDPANNKDAPTSPFVMPQYILQSRTDAQKLEDQAAAFYKQYQAAAQRSTEYILTTVILASALFFTGFSTRIGWRQIEITLILMAIALLAYGIYRIVVLQFS
jgi:hypothetical protein